MSYINDPQYFNPTLRWLAEGAFWEMNDPVLFAERIMEHSLLIFGM